MPPTVPPAEPAAAAPAPFPAEAVPPEPWALPFPDEAGPADILNCFRLFLGRRPNREEWHGHSSRAGEKLDRVVASYAGSLEFSRRALGNAADPGTGLVLARRPDYEILVSPDDAAVGGPVLRDLYEHDVAAVFRARLRPGMGVLDLGANIGYFALLSAALVGPRGHVTAVEPNGANVRLLEASRRHNDFAQLRIVQAAAGLAPGILVLHRDFSNGTTSAPPDGRDALLAAETVGCVRAETLPPPGRRVDLVKVDVEGAEYLALGGCEALLRRWRPLIVSEFSPSLMPGISGVSGPEYLRWLRGLGYRLGVIGEHGAVAAMDPDGIMAEHRRRGRDHLDLLCEPERAAARWRGRLRRWRQRAPGSRSIASR